MGGEEKERENANNSSGKELRNRQLLDRNIESKEFCFVVFLNVEDVGMLMEMIQEK